MSRTRFLLSGLMCVGTVASVTLAQNQQPTSDSAPPQAQIDFQQFTLKNGLRVILSEDHSAPTYSICVTYNAGSRDERPGRTGFAHLFEHMMFQGSENVGKGEHFILIQNNGGSMNGTTNADRTNYFQTLPANQLELGLFLEADRMRSLAINQANLDNQRNVVQEERRLAIDNQPYGKTFEIVLETAYDNFAYKHPTIGSMEDLDAATLEDVAEFFRIYYAPNNAVLTLVGDFQTEETLAKIGRYFGDIPSQPDPPEPDMTEPEQKEGRRTTIEDPFAPTPRLDIVHKTPPANTPDWYALDVLTEVLASGRSSRLYQKLVKEHEVAVDVFGGAQELRGPSLAWLIILARPDKDLAEVEKLVDEEIHRIQNEPIADWELAKFRMQLRRQRAQELQSTLHRAMRLGQYAVYYDEPSLINTREAKVTRITKEDILRAAQKYLNPTNRTVVTTLPQQNAAARAAPPPAQADSKGVSVTSVERKNKSPVSEKVLQVTLPKPKQATLDNGLTVLVIEDHRLPVVSVLLHLGGAGPIHEPTDLPGLAHITAEMLQEGTLTRTSQQIAEEIDRLGATLSASSDFGSTAAEIRASGLSDNFDEWFALVSDIVLHPTFPQEELVKLKARTQTELRQRRSSPSFLVNERFHRAVFGDHPAAIVSETDESLDALTREMLLQWHQERYVPQNAILGIAGDVNAEELVLKLKGWLTEWQATDLSTEMPPDPMPRSRREIALVDRPGSVQASVAMGNVAIDRRHPDYIPMVVMNRVLGGGPAARLFINLREEKGYTYGAYSSFTALQYPGSWRAAGDMRTDATDGAMTEFLRELRRIREETVPQSELEEAKRSLVARFALSLEQPMKLLDYALERKIYGFPTDYWDTYPAKIMTASADDVQQVAERYINLDSIQIVAVGDANSIQPVLQKYGSVEVFDTEGHPVSTQTTSDPSPKP